MPGAGRPVGSRCGGHTAGVRVVRPPCLKDSESEPHRRVGRGANAGALFTGVGFESSALRTRSGFVLG
jgi:hypothetical protein